LTAVAPTAQKTALVVASGGDIDAQVHRVFPFQDPTQTDFEFPVWRGQEFGTGKR
jgi:hypothetical protein